MAIEFKTLDMKNFMSVGDAAGIKLGDLSIYAGAGRSSGKSMYTQQMIGRALRKLAMEPILWSKDPDMMQKHSFAKTEFVLYPSRPIPPETRAEMETFCLDTFGGGGSVEDFEHVLDAENLYYSQTKNAGFWFLKEADRVLFFVNYSG